MPLSAAQPKMSNPVSSSSKTRRGRSATSMSRGRSTASMSRREPTDPRVRKFQLLFHRKTQKRRLYMEELKELRDDTYGKVYKEIKKSIGPTWYQVLTKRHQKSLNTLRQAIHQGMLEGRPTHAMRVIRALAIYPPPHPVDVFNCMEASHRDPMEFLSRLFYILYEHDFASKRHAYDYNARMLLSSIFYLGLPGLKKILEYQFWPDHEWPETPPEPKPKPPPPHPSPYLRPLIAPLYDPQPPPRKRPPPLPDLSFLDKAFEDVPPRPRPLPPPPPPPPPKKTVPLPYCYDLADYHPIHLHPKWKNYGKTKDESITNLKRSGNLKSKRSSKMGLVTVKKVYGLGDFLPPRKQKKQKLHPPKTGLDNEQYTIHGVYLHNDRMYYLIGNLVIMPPNGYLIHGGIVMFKGRPFMLLLGVRLPIPPPREATACSCLETMYGTAVNYVKKTKCYCEHRYDYKNTGELPDEDDEEPYFKRPTFRGPYQFNYEAIFEGDSKEVQVRQDINKIHEEDSILIMVNPDEKDPDKIAESKKKQRKKELKMYKEPLPTCLGDSPKLEDYLRCALRQVRRLNIAARLPEVYLTRELLEWMRKRIYGPFTREQRRHSVRAATTRFTYLKAFEKMGLGITKFFPYPDYFTKKCTWASKAELNRLFEQFKLRYRIKVYKAHANFSNMFWACMDLAEFPDKNFREIYWSYMMGRVTEVVLNHPYSPVEAQEFYTRKIKRRYRCLAKGATDIERR